MIIYITKDGTTSKHTPKCKCKCEYNLQTTGGRQSVVVSPHVVEKHNRTFCSNRFSFQQRNLIKCPRLQCLLFIHAKLLFCAHRHRHDTWTLALLLPALASVTLAAPQKLSAPPEYLLAHSPPDAASGHRF